MPRLARVDVGNEIYHVINRANGRMQIFNKPEDYRVLRTVTKRRMLRKLHTWASEGARQSYVGLLSHGNTYKILRRIL